MGFHSKIAGVTHKNDDGTDRQTLVRLLKPGDPLKLVREPDNPHGTTAIKICTSEGYQLGYANSEVSHELSPEIDAGTAYEAFVTKITGGGEGFSYGCNFYIQEVGERDIDEVLTDDTYKETSPRIASTESPKETPSKKKRSCLGCLGKMILAVIIGMIVLIIIGFLIGDQAPEDENSQESSVVVSRLVDV